MMLKAISIQILKREKGEEGETNKLSKKRHDQCLVIVKKKMSEGKIKIVKIKVRKGGRR